MDEIMQFLSLVGHLPPGTKQLLLAYIQCGGPTVLAYMAIEANCRVGEHLKVMASASIPEATGETPAAHFAADAPTPPEDQQSPD